MLESEKSICFCCGCSLKLFVQLKYFCNSYWKQSNYLSATHYCICFCDMKWFVCHTLFICFCNLTLFVRRLLFICFCNLKLFVFQPLLHLCLQLDIVFPPPTVSATWNYLSAVHFPQMCPLLILHSEAAKPLTNLVFRCTTVLESQSTPPHQ